MRRVVPFARRALSPRGLLAVAALTAAATSAAAQESPSTSDAAHLAPPAAGAPAPRAPSAADSLAPGAPAPAPGAPAPAPGAPAPGGPAPAPAPGAPAPGGPAPAPGAQAPAPGAYEAPPAPASPPLPPPPADVPAESGGTGELYHHGLPVEHRHDGAQAAAGYRKGFFIREGEDFELVIQGRIQGLFQLDHFGESDPATRENFQIRRARFSLQGHAFTPHLGYKLQVAFERGGVSLKDFITDYHFAPLPIIFRLGQWKRPFSRQQIASTSRLEFVDRAITDAAFDNGRDIGIGLHNDYEASPPVEWFVGIFNGANTEGQLRGDVRVDPVTGEGEIVDGAFSNVPAQMKPTLLARIGFNQGGIKGYSEGDLEGGPLRTSVALSGMAHFNHDDSGEGALLGGLDFVAKAYGLSATGGLFLASVQRETFSDQRFARLGVYSQVGYVIAEQFEPALRYALVAPSGEADDVHEFTASLNLYSFGHAVEWKVDGSILRSETSVTNWNTDSRLRVQFQLSF